MAKDKKDIKIDILNMFRSLRKEDPDLLASEFLESDYTKHLKWDEKQHYQNAVKELESNGLVQYVKGSNVKIKLTEKGANLIHS